MVISQEYIDWCKKWDRIFLYGKVMADKYYTPTIEEFHVGFEYEKNDGAIEPNWRSYTCIDVPLFDKNTVIKKVIAEGGLRVKYLDKEDIKSLSWKYDNNAEPYPEKEPYECPIAFDIDTQLENGICYILYLYKDNVVWVEWIKDCAGMGYIFKGTIKNKSELKILMKQLGIDGNTK